MQDAWTARKSDEIQGYGDRNEWKNFFSAIKAVYGPPTNCTAPLPSADGSTLLTEKTQILQRWASISEASSTAPPLSPTPPSSVCRKWRPTWSSTSRHLSRKPSGACSSSPAGKHPDRTQSLLRESPSLRQLRGISLLNVAGKIFAPILLNRLNNHLEQGLLPESQCDLRCHRVTTDMIFADRQLQEKCQEMRTHLSSTYVELTKAFDTVNREGL
nr:unnamed protein product [Spirometra erinaceieuropaei]